MYNTKISVVICTYNRIDLLIRTLNALSIQTISPFEIIVVDNNSSDKTKDIVQQFIKTTNQRLIYLFEPKQGATIARNAGGFLAKGNVIAFLDDDVIPKEDYIENLIKAFSEKELDYIGGGIELEYLVPKPDWLDDRLAGILAYCDYGNNIIEFPCQGKKYPISANIAIKKEIFEAVNGFLQNELNYKWSKPCNDDILFGTKVHKAGYKLTYLPNITVKHLIPKERLTVDYFKACFYFYGVADIIHQIIPNNLKSYIYIIPRSLFRLTIGFIKLLIISETKEKHWQLFRIYYNWGLIVGIIRSKLTWIS